MYITAYFKMLVMPDMQSDQDHKSPGLETSGISAVTYVLIQNWNFFKISLLWKWIFNFIFLDITRGSCRSDFMVLLSKSSRPPVLEKRCVWEKPIIDLFWERSSIFIKSLVKVLAWLTSSIRSCCHFHRAVLTYPSFFFLSAPAFLVCFQNLQGNWKSCASKAACWATLNTSWQSCAKHQEIIEFGWKCSHHW